MMSDDDIEIIVRKILSTYKITDMVLIAFARVFLMNY